MGSAQRKRRSSRLDCGLGAGGPAVRIVGPVPVKPGHAPLDALVVAGESAVLDDRIVQAARLAVAQHDASGAVTARDVVGLPGPERDFVDAAKAGDLELRIPVGAFLFPELVGDHPHCLFARGDPPVITWAEQPEIQFQRVGGGSRLAERQQAAYGAEGGCQSWSFHGRSDVAHMQSEGWWHVMTVPRSRDLVKCSAATLGVKSATGARAAFFWRRMGPKMPVKMGVGECER